MRALTDAETDLLDTLIHETSVKHVLEALAQLCFERNDHHRKRCDAAGDKLGSYWKRAGDQLMRTADTRAVHGVEP